MPKAIVPHLRFTERMLNSLEAREKTYEVADTESPLRVRVRPTGARSFIVVGRIAGGPSATTMIGRLQTVMLDHARKEAIRVRSEMALGIKPKSRSQIAKEQRAAVEAKRKAETPIEELVRVYIEERRTGKQKAWRNLDGRERDMLRVTRPWHGRPAGGISYDDIRHLIGGFTAKGQHRSAVGAVRDLQGLFGWLAHERRIAISPFAGMKSGFLLGGAADLKARERVLDDAELRLVWDGAGKIDAPYGTILRLLILLGLRRNEVAGLRWGEIDLANHRLTLPPERNKTKIKLVVPVVGIAADILRAVPKPKLAEPGDRVFRSPRGYEITGLDHLKKRLDAMIGDKLAPWVVHDLRRSMRSGLSRLVDARGNRLVNFDVAERLIGHKVGSSISRVYDRELPWKAMTEAATLWSQHVASLIGANVTRLPAKPKRAVEA